MKNHNLKNRRSITLDWRMLSQPHFSKRFWIPLITIISFSFFVTKSAAQTNDSGTTNEKWSVNSNSSSRDSRIELRSGSAVTLADYYSINNENGELKIKRDGATKIYMNRHGAMSIASSITPAYELDVYGRTGMRGDLIFNPQRTGNIRFKFLGTSANYDWQWVNLSGDLHFQTNSINNVMKIKQNGNVGIGVFDPGKKLDVGGDARMSGTVTATSFIGDGSQLTGINATHDGNFNSNVSITGNLDVNGWVNTNNISSYNIQKSGQAFPQFSVLSNGNVGIGLGNPLTRLAVGGDAKVYGKLDATGTVTATSFIGDGSQLTGINATHDGNFNSNVSITGNLDVNGWVNTNNISSYNIQKSGQAFPQFTVLSNGNVGIGLGNPQTRLTVGGDAKVYGKLDATGTVTATRFIGDGSQLTGINTVHNGIFNSDVNVNGKIKASSLLVNGWITTGGGAYFTHSVTANSGLISRGLDIKGPIGSETKIDLSSNGTITAAGTVTATSFVGDGSQLTGINATHDGNFNSNVSITGNLDVNGWVNTNNISSYNIQKSGQAFPQFTVLSNGNVGIGLGNPQTRLTVGGDAKVYGKLDVSEDLNVTGDLSVIENLIFNKNRLNDSRGLQFHGTSADKDWKWVNLSGDLHFQTNSINNVMKIKQNGNVGIGVFDPGKKLDVGGDARISGTVTATSFVGDGSQLTGINADHDGIFDSNVSVNGNLDVTGNITQNGQPLDVSIPGLSSDGVDGNWIVNKSNNAGGQLTINGSDYATITDFKIRHAGNKLHFDINGESWIQIFKNSMNPSASQISFSKKIIAPSMSVGTFSTSNLNISDLNVGRDIDLKGSLRIYKEEQPALQGFGGGALGSPGSATFDIQSQNDKLEIAEFTSSTGSPGPSLFSLDTNGKVVVSGETSTGTLTVGNDPGEALAPGTVAHFDGRVYISEEGAGAPPFRNTTNDTTSNPNFANYLLWVEEGIASKDFALAETSDWPDYVFESGYDLNSLEEVADFIQEEGHLPHFPAADEVETMGYTVDDMTKRLVQTIEEMTLYSIEQENKIQKQDKQIDEQHEQLQKQNSQIQELFKRLEALESSNK